MSKHHCNNPNCKRSDQSNRPTNHEHDLHDLKAFIERVKAMTPEELVACLISAGINNPDGTLTERYK